MVATYLATLGERLSAGALARRAAAIAAQHRQHGLASPASDQAVTMLLRHARRTATRRRAPPPTVTRLIRMATACPGDLAGLRDRALLLLAAAGLGRATLVGLDVEQVHFMEAGVDLVLHKQLGAAGCSERSTAGAMSSTVSSALDARHRILACRVTRAAVDASAAADALLARLRSQARAGWREKCARRNSRRHKTETVVRAFRMHRQPRQADRDRHRAGGQPNRQNPWRRFRPGRIRRARVRRRRLRFSQLTVSRGRSTGCWRWRRPKKSIWRVCRSWPSSRRSQPPWKQH